jgi:hypothetical protein
MCLERVKAIECLHSLFWSRSPLPVLACESDSRFPCIPSSSGQAVDMAFPFESPGATMLTRALWRVQNEVFPKCVAGWPRSGVMDG